MCVLISIFEWVMFMHFCAGMYGDCMCVFMCIVLFCFVSDGVQKFYVHNIVCHILSSSKFQGIKKISVT